MTDLPINQVLCGDAAELMRGLPDASIHAIVTDPPYGLEFMGEEWDKFRKRNHPFEPSGGSLGKRAFGWDSKRMGMNYGYPKKNPRCKKCGRLRWGREISICHCEQPDFDHRTAEYPREFQKWTTAWAREALRVLLPGASMLVMGGTRTYHRMACGVEDAGFEVKDTILWCYNSGFPKAQDLGKLIDRRNYKPMDFKPFGEYLQTQREKKGLSKKQIDEMLGTNTAFSWWEGRKTGIQYPTWEHYQKLKEILDLDDRFDHLIKWAEAEREKIGEDSRSAKPENTTVNMGIGFGKWDLTAPATPLAREWDGWKVGGLKPSYEPVVWAVKPPEGSTTDNVLKHGVGAINVDACRIPYESEDEKWTIPPKRRTKRSWRAMEKRNDILSPENDFSSSEQGRYPANMVRTDRFEDGYDRFYFVPKAERAERWFKCQICNIYQDGTHLWNHRAHALHCLDCRIDFPNTDEEKEAHKNHRTDSNIVSHPTVKPVALGEFLIKLVTREGQIVLDQFCGLGSFLVAARNLNRQYIGFDNGSEYYEMARRRLAAIPPPLGVFA